MKLTKAFVIAATTSIFLLLTAGCPKPAATPNVPPAPVAAVVSAPAISFFTADPAATTTGQPALLRWSVQGAEHVRIDNNIGDVEASGSRSIQLATTTTYQLEATNAAGTSVAHVTLSISSPTAPAASASGLGGATTASVVATQLQDIHFSYDQDNVLEAETGIVTKDTLILKSLFAADPGVIVVIEGHCDERGSSEYNIALGDKRARYVKDLFIRSGLPETKLNTVSFGKESPVCLDPTEACFTNNRRVHFSAAK